ncbi:MAG: tyrosine-type recombinase/integrase [Calditrichota bacterium]
MPVTVRWRDAKKGRVYFLDILHEGRRKKHALGVVSLKEAKAAAAKVERELLTNGWGEKVPQSRSYEQFVIEYLAVSKARKAYNTFRTDRDSLNAFGSIAQGMLLEQITTDNLEQFRMQSLKRIKPSSVNVALRHLKAAFAWAHRRGYINSDPAIGVKLNRIATNTHLRFLKEEEIQRLRNVIGDDVALRRFVDFALWTGLRRDEIVHLQWSDIDLERRTITVQNKKDFHTKSGKSRVVPINPQLSAMLTEMQNGKIGDDDRVFDVNYWTIGKQFRAAAKRTGLDGHVSLHILRHTFASHLVMQGVDLPSVQAILGHHSVSVTMIYSHLTPGHLAKTVEKLPY